MYQISNNLINIENMIPTLNSKRLDLFKIDSTQHADSNFKLYTVSKIEFPKKDSIIYKNNQFIVAKNNNIHEFYYYMEGRIYAKVVEYDDENNKIYMLESMINEKLHPYLFPSLLGLERRLIKKASVILHSSYIVYENQSILFSAPSGGGKSTQAELWKRYKNAVIANGDKSIISKQEGKFYSCGVPFSGSSEYCLNITKPLKAIILLEKGPTNKIDKVGLKGFNKVFSQITINSWDEEFSRSVVDRVMDICFSVPVYLYTCTKKEDAVDYLFNYLVKEGVLDGVF